MLRKQKLSKALRIALLKVCVPDVSCLYLVRDTGSINWFAIKTIGHIGNIPQRGHDCNARVFDDTHTVNRKSHVVYI